MDTRCTGQNLSSPTTTVLMYVIIVLTFSCWLQGFEDMLRSLVEGQDVGFEVIQLPASGT
jgi:hypothetical protein